MRRILIINPWAGRIGPNTFITGFIEENLGLGNELTVIYPFPDEISEYFHSRGCEVIYLRLLKLTSFDNLCYKLLYRFITESILFFVFIYLSLRKKYNYGLVNTELFSFSLIVPSFIFELNFVVHSLSFTGSLLSKVIFKVQQIAACNYVAVSIAVKSSLLKFGIKKPVHMVYNGLNLNYFSINSGPVRKNSEIVEILAVIHSLPHKGAHYLLDVLRQLLDLNSNFHCTIVGWGSPLHDQKYKEMIESRVRLYGLHKFITFKGSTNDIRREYLKSDILVHPSESESFGYVIAEAMALKLPVIAFGVGGVLEIVEQNQSGVLIAPYDVSQMASRLLTLIEDKELRKRYGIRGRKIVEEKFNLKTNMGKVLKIFEGS